MASISTDSVFSTESASEGQTVFNFLKARKYHAKNCQDPTQPKNKKKEITYNAITGEVMTPKEKTQKKSKNVIDEIDSFLDVIETEYKKELARIAEFDALIKFQKGKDAQKKIKAEKIAYGKSPKGKAWKELIAIAQREINEWKGHPELNTGQLTDKATQRFKEQTKEIENKEKKYSFEPDTKKIIIREASELQPVEQMPTFHKTTKTQAQRISELIAIIKK